jgi:DNA repair protein RecO (recombination protein O)
MHITTQGLGLRETSYKEADKILTVLTGDAGKITVRARGALRRGCRYQAAAQLLVYSEMTLFSYKDHFSLDEGTAIEAFRGVREDLDALSLASYFAELTELLTNEDCATPEILSLFLNSLHALGTLKKPPALVKAAFELRLLSLAGYEPLLDACAVCGGEDPEHPALHLREGVLCCAACRDEVGEGVALPLDAAALLAARRIVYGDPKRLFSFRLEGKSLRLLGDASEAFALTQLERGFRTLDYYKKLTT